MTTDRWERTKQILEDALRLAPAKRAAYLASACANDATLRVEVESLIAAHEAAGSQFLDSPAPVVLNLTSHAPGSRAGQTVSHYKILQEIGRGGMGVVYKAEDTRLHRLVALKFLPGELASTPTAYERFEREAQAASSLDHPNICSIYQLGEHEDQPFIVMQLLDGQTLREWIETSAGDKTPPPLEDLLDIAIQITDGLEAAHHKGIIHRDIKPANIIITRRKQAKILDFGVAKFMDAADFAFLKPEGDGIGDETDLSAAANLHLTRTGMSVGTPTYLSPEQLRREKLDARTDLFSFGLVLYEMATGQRPFSGPTATTMRDAVLLNPEVPARKINPALPSELEAIITRALEKDREKRYQSASEIREDLLRVKGSAIPERTLRPTARSAISRALAHVKMRRWRKFVIPFTAALLAVLTLAVLQQRARQAKRLSEQDTIVLADFANSTNDAVFDGTLKQGLGVALSQSPFLNILPDGKVRSILKLMTKPANATLSSSIASEVCQRSGSKAYIVGAIAALGTDYVIGLKAENCQVGELLAEEQITARSKDEIIPALGNAASHLRQKLGESISSVKQFDVPLREATTGSLEALKEFTLGGLANNENGAVAAIPHYQKAVALDPLFARAYGSLAVTYADNGENSLAAAYATKAYQLRDHGTPLETIQIDADYYGSVTGNLPKVVEAYQHWAALRPRSPSPHDNLSYVYSQMGQNEKSLAETLSGLRLAQSGPAYYNAMCSYIALNRLNEAKAVISEAESHNMNMPVNHNNLYMIAFLEHDHPAMEREAAWAMGKEGIEDAMLYYQANTSAYSGQLKKAWGLSQRASDSAIRADNKETAAGYLVSAALFEALSGNQQEAEHQLAKVLAPSSGQDVQAAAALAYAFAGDQTRARALADILASKFPENTLVQFNYLPAIRGQLAVDSKNGKHALELLEPARTYELGQPAQAMLLNLYPIFVRAQAYLAAHDGSAAAAEFQKIIDHPGMALNEPIAALVHLGLARSYALQGDPAKAESAYQDFLTLWKDADPDLPVLKRAKIEYAKLKVHSRAAPSAAIILAPAFDL